MNYIGSEEIRVHSPLEYKLARRRIELNPNISYTLRVFLYDNENYKIKFLPNIECLIINGTNSTGRPDVVIQNCKALVLQDIKCGSVYVYNSTIYSITSSTEGCIELISCHGRFSGEDIKETFIRIRDSVMSITELQVNCNISNSSCFLKDCSKVKLEWCKNVILMGSSNFQIGGITEQTHIKVYNECNGIILSASSGINENWLELHDFTNINNYCGDKEIGEGIKLFDQARVYTTISSAFCGISTDTPYITKNNTYYKAVRIGKINISKNNELDKTYQSFYDSSFTYKLGGIITPESFNPNVNEVCSAGIHMSNMDWAIWFAIQYSYSVSDFALLEVEPIHPESVVVGDCSDGKLRCDGVIVKREVPPKEWGFWYEYFKKYIE